MIACTDVLVNKKQLEVASWNFLTGRVNHENPVGHGHAHTENLQLNRAHIPSLITYEVDDNINQN